MIFFFKNCSCFHIKINIENKPHIIGPPGISNRFHEGCPSGTGHKRKGPHRTVEAFHTKNKRSQKDHALKSHAYCPNCFTLKF